MKESSVNILIAEYDRLKELEKLRLENYERGLQLYVAVITAGIGILLFILEGKMPLSPPPLSVLCLLLFILFIGETSFLRMVGADIAIAENARAFLCIRKEFIKADSEIRDAFLKGLAQNKKRYSSWSSVLGVITRALSVSQQKTAVVLLNCLVSAIGVIILVSPKTIWLAVIIGIGVAILAGLLHALYASWRYRRQAGEFQDTGDMDFWA